MDVAPTAPGLFGIKSSNRDFTQARGWGKNIFNGTFPVALANYMYSREIPAVYLKLDKNRSVVHDYLPIDQVFGLNPLGDDVHFSFETPFQQYMEILQAPTLNVDLVTMHHHQGHYQEVRPIEIKLTALPDTVTSRRGEDRYAPELVIRQPSVVYLALAIASAFRETDRRHYLSDKILPLAEGIESWGDSATMRPRAGQMLEVLDAVLVETLDLQQPFLLQPVWKTVGTSTQLADQCLDVFVWSNYSFTRLFLRDWPGAGVGRSMRSLFWLIRMLNDFCAYGRMSKAVCDQMDFGTRTDKAFAVSGSVTYDIMRCKELQTPRVPKAALTSIILGDGYKLLSPERRFDAAIVAASPELFGEGLK